ncbi:MAG: fumarate hydratase [Chloroflexota bacterium]
MEVLSVPAGFYDSVEETARALYVRALKDIPPDVRRAVEAALRRETNASAQAMLKIILRAIETSDQRDMLVCQDTGIPIYWAAIGSRLALDGSRLQRAIVKGTERATVEHPLRSSIVSPLGRQNRQTSTGDGIPAIHLDFLDGADYLDLLMVPKGSGSENMSFLKMLVPADGIKGIKRFVLECVVEAGANPCPPTIVGVGIGGSSDQCMALAKKAAVTRPVGQSHPDPEIAALEAELLEAINRTGIGVQGLGGDTTALAVHVEQAWTHITMNPVAVNLQCWRGERAAARVWPDGRVEAL